MREDETKEANQEKKIYSNMNGLRSILIEINTMLHDYESGMNRIDGSDVKVEPLRGELGRLEKDKIPDWDSQTLSEKIWYTKAEAEKILNYLQTLNRRFNSLI